MIFFSLSQEAFITRNPTSFHVVLPMKKIFIGILTTCWKVATRTIPKIWSQGILHCFWNFCVHEIHLFLFAKFRGNPALQWLIYSSSVGKKTVMLYKCMTLLPQEMTEMSFNINFSLPPFLFTVPNLKSLWRHCCLGFFWAACSSP